MGKIIDVKTIKYIFICFLMGLSLLLKAQHYPHPDTTDYREDYRGQFHFSPQTEWMNDINGLVYQGGKYHMIYQWGKTHRHGGYATSEDLLHWKDEGVALIPRQTFLKGVKQNVSGWAIYSGSAVVVSGELAGKITGSELETIIAIYTGTGIGTCLAWSNDVGRTWHDYYANPVANATKTAYPRDPCVIWHENSQSFILALYENGTTFYGSEDLITWDSLSNINFGYECPDLFQLPLDGDENNMKWVLQDANGTYLVGEFDGISFTMDEGQDTMIMDVGPDFYAAQTFPAGNLPKNDKRIIQLAWMDHWNGGAGETYWERNATIPVSLALVTYNGQKRITRNPIEEFSDLHGKSKKWKNEIIKSGENLLSDISSKTFDLTIEVDLNETKATKFGVKVADKVIEYDISKKTLLEKELLTDESGLLTIRMLVDWAQLEIFAAEGVYSYTEHYGFAPERSVVEFYSDGDVNLVRMELIEVNRIW